MTEEINRTELDIMRDSLKVLRDLTNIQCSNGTWNYDQYMHGMANGMILALSLFDEGEPDYLHAPDEWLSEKKNHEIAHTK